MNNSLEHLKVGDEVYAPHESYKPYSYGVIVGFTPKMWLVSQGKGNPTVHEILTKVRKLDGHEMGGMFSSTWYPMTDDVRRRRELSNRYRVYREKIATFDDSRVVKITSKNIDRIEELVDEILRLGKVVEK
jgi:hypothetical protein